MSTILIERVRHSNGKEKPPVFAEAEKTIEKIQQRAFKHFEERGGLTGFDRQDWLLAEHEVLGPSLAELVVNDREVKLKVAVPGVDSKDVIVTATPNSLVVKANSGHIHSGTDGEIRFCEFTEDTLCREFGLPSPIDVNTVSASLDMGILQVVAAKAPQQSHSA
jgi:HSP20 family molecular chaperone IbpA